MLRRLFAVTIQFAAAASALAQWSQFGANQRHTGNTSVVGQPLVRTLAEVVHDPFVPDEIDPGSGDLHVHYAVPLLDGDDVFMSYKESAIIGPFFPITQWSVHRLHWENGQLVEKWAQSSDWYPIPDGSGIWEPVMQPVIANGSIYMPAAGGTLLQLDRTTGAVIRRINPFGSIDGMAFVSGPPTADSSGNIFYGAFKLQQNAPWSGDILGSWLVRVTPAGVATIVPFAPLVTNAPAASAQCTSEFPFGSVQHPPSPDAVAPSTTCGSQRPGINIAPAIASDGTIYMISRTHFNDRWGYLVAINPDLTAKWSQSFRERFHDGCGVLLPPANCTAGAHVGVDPDDNLAGSGRVEDSSTASPVILPDGSIVYGSFSYYNDRHGHLIHFSASGAYLGAYPFGWDTTPAVWQHDGTYSLVTKENFYGDPLLRTDPGDFVTQLSPQLQVEWQYRNPSRTVCRDGDCDSEEFGFEWCVNATAIDAQGTVYANSEDGILYAIAQGGILLDRVSLAGPLGAAYTPVAIDAQGRVYAQTGGHLFAVGGVPARKRAVR
jgi:outer membrane protein assembly factor BamB